MRFLNFQICPCPEQNSILFDGVARLYRNYVEGGQPTQPKKVKVGWLNYLLKYFTNEIYRFLGLSH